MIPSLPFGTRPGLGPRPLGPMAPMGPGGPTVRPGPPMGAGAPMAGPVPPSGDPWRDAAFMLLRRIIEEMATGPTPRALGYIQALYQLTSQRTASPPGLPAGGRLPGSPLMGAPAGPLTGGPLPPVGLPPRGPLPPVGPPRR